MEISYILILNAHLKYYSSFCMPIAFKLHRVYCNILILGHRRPLCQKLKKYRKTRMFPKNGFITQSKSMGEFKIFDFEAFQKPSKLIEIAIFICIF